ncbi:MAG TPA: formylglycine-generating enzyme family protein [Phycisphaerae bacterium]|nr:formylglycine-generating enzyme family protein [Phycisphaerae bacterium]HRR86154.1 formylglycine-generating enzyme family protein [Phycisphaerae bacterium]
MSTSRMLIGFCVLAAGLLGGTAVAVVPADFDGDGDVDSVDLDLFEDCATSPGVPWAIGCDDKDLDADGDVDQADFGIFQRSLGSGVPMVLIPGGEFVMGDSFDEGNADELPRHVVYVDAFYMDRYEVTNQQYADALNWANSQGNLITVTGGVVYKYGGDAGYPYCDTTASSSGSRITWDGMTFGVTPGRENHPVVRVSWYGAAAYANWRSAMQGKAPAYDLSTWNCEWNGGYRLPTEAEWEKAARGGAAETRFSWSDSNDIRHSRANYYSDWSDGVPYYPYDKSPTQGYHPAFDTGAPPYTSPVGYFAANDYDLCDMVGNVWEWCNDWSSGTYYGSSPYSNPTGPSSGTYRVLRGGAWDYDAFHCRVACRYGFGPAYRSFYIGFRLVLDSP